MTTTEQDGAAFRWPVRAYYEDTDAAGVVYYANYLKFMERARTEWLRAAGFEQTTLRDELGVVFVVRAVAIEYLQPAHFNDALETTVEPETVRGSSFVLKQAVWRGDALIVTAQVRIVCVNTQTFRPVRIPTAVLEKLAMREA